MDRELPEMDYDQAFLSDGDEHHSSSGYSSTDNGETKIIGPVSASAPLGIVADLEENEEDVLEREPTSGPCTKESEVDTEPEFDYYDFMEYNRLQNLLSEIEKWDNFNEAAFSKLSPLLNQDGQVNDEGFKFYLNKFVDKYGKVDESNPQRLLPVLKTMRETMVKMYGKPLPKEQIFDLLADEGITAKGIKDGRLKLKSLISQRFPSYKQSEFCLHPKNSGGDWFNLPRPSLTQTRFKYFDDFETYQLKEGALEEIAGPKEKNPMKGPQALKKYVPEAFTTGSDTETFRPSQVIKKDKNLAFHEKNIVKVNVTNASSADSQDEILYTCRALTNLHVYDPKFELCFNMPYRIFSTNSGRDKKSPVPKMLSCAILRLLNEHPSGITQDKFWSKFQASKNYLPDVPLIRYEDLLKYHAEEVCFVKQEKLPALVFPSFLEGSVDPNCILHRIWHAILCMFEVKGAVVVDRIFPTLKESYGFTFDPRDWGFPDTMKFLQFCLKYFQLQKYMKIYQVIYMKDYVAHSVQYLMPNSKDLQRSLEAFYGNVPREEEKPKKKKIVIPKGYMKMCDQIEMYSNHVISNSTQFTKLLRYRNPDRMSLISLSLLTKLEDFQESLQMAPYLGDITAHPPPPYNLLKPGLYVMVTISYDNTNPQWYRARIIWHDEVKQELFVFCIDWGNLTYVKYEDVRFMPRSARVEPGFAIPVELEVNPPPQSKGKREKWEHPEACNALMKLTGTRILKTIYHHGNVSVAMGCRKWTVTMSIIDEYDLDVKYPSLSEAFLIEYKRRLQRRDRKKLGAEGHKSISGIIKD